MGDLLEAIARPRGPEAGEWCAGPDESKVRSRCGSQRLTSQGPGECSFVPFRRFACYLSRLEKPRYESDGPLVRAYPAADEESTLSDVRKRLRLLSSCHGRLVN